MKCIAIKQFGDVDVLQKIEMDKPSVTSGHVLIKVLATSVNPLDFKLRKGYFPDLVSNFPMILHGDVAGIVAEVGEGVSKFKVGDEVYGCAGGLVSMHGALAEYMLADENLLALKPQSISFAEAAALPLVSLTAWEALITRANLQKNQSILIHGGTGGVGHVAVQLANWLGAKVYSTSSAEKKLFLAKQLGAHVVINYKTSTPEEYLQAYTQCNGFNVVFDTVGGENIHRSIQAAAPFGQVISILPSAAFDSAAAFSKHLSLHYVFQPLPLITGINRVHYGEILKNIAKLVDEGMIRPLIDEREFTIDDVAAAHDYLESGNAIGKVVIHVA